MFLPENTKLVKIAGAEYRQMRKDGRREPPSAEH
jgi:hypothetical protein